MIIHDYKELFQLSAQEIDQMLAQGWRHFGERFFRYNLTIHRNEVCRVMSLRLLLSEYAHKKKHRRILRDIAQFSVSYRPLTVTEEMQGLFSRHKQRFEDNEPESIYTFVSEQKDVPIRPMECCIYDGTKLIAASFFDEGETSVSSIYGMFDLNYSQYSLGIATMLLEIDYSKNKQKEFYYHGYCYDVPSFYDYKKRFPALYYYDWKGQWRSYEAYPF